MAYSIFWSFYGESLENSPTSSDKIETLLFWFKGGKQVGPYLEIYKLPQLIGISSM